MLIIVPAGAMHSQEEGFSVGLRFYLLETKVRHRGRHQMMMQHTHGRVMLYEGEHQMI